MILTITMFAVSILALVISISAFYKSLAAYRQGYVLGLERGIRLGLGHTNCIEGDPVCAGANKVAEAYVRSCLQMRAHNAANPVVKSVPSSGDTL